MVCCIISKAILLYIAQLHELQCPQKPHSGFEHNSFSTLMRSQACCWIDCRWATIRAGSALTMRGHKLPAGRVHNWFYIAVYNIIHSYELADLTCVDIITAVGSYLVRPRFFSESLWEGLERPPPRSNISEATWNSIRDADDVWISGQLARNGIPREAIPGRSQRWTSKSPPSEYASKMIIRPWVDADLQTAPGSPVLGGGPYVSNMLLLTEFAADWSCPGSMHTVADCLLGPHKEDVPRMTGVPCTRLSGELMHR